jgi:hypothetical protein
VRFLSPSINKNNRSDRKKNHKYFANKALISIGPRNLKLVQKITFKRNLRQIFRIRIEIPELNKKIRQIKKIEGYNQKKDRNIRQIKKIERYNQKKDRKNTITMEMII